MRPLLILCEPKHAAMIRIGVSRFAHPRLTDDFVSIIEIDVDGHVDREDVHFRILERVRQDAWPARATGRPQIAATDAVYGAIGLKAFLNGRDIESTKLFARDIGQLDKTTNSTPQLHTILGSCDLSLHNASAALLSKWSHSVVDLRAVTEWQNQFANLGKEYRWMSEFILRSVVMIDATDLTDCLATIQVDRTVAACYNKDERGTPKSGEVVAGLLHKRDPLIKIYDAPANAFEIGTHSSVVVFEDGLWTGTEAVGILESLRGERPGRAKTKPLSDPNLLKTCDLSLAYAVATDYGLALMRRYAKDKGFDRVSFCCAREVQIAAPCTIDLLSDPSYDPSELFVTGPTASSIQPYIIELARQHLGDEKARQLQSFCTIIGRQLFDNYLTEQVRDRGWSWDKWPEERRALSALGMHNMALTYAFAHSIPKATLPLLWGRGQVTLGSRQVVWKPLFQNS